MGGQHSNLLANSYCDWWTLAGVDSLVGETPSAWLSQAACAPVIAEPQTKPESNPLAGMMALQRTEPEPSRPAKPAEPVEMPTDWSEFQQWLAKSENVPGSQWDARRVLPVGESGAPLMLLTGWPEMDDQRQGTLYTGAASTLVDAMLRAIGLSRAQCYVASLAVTRPPGGRCSTVEAAELQRLMWHHMRLAKPARLVLIGNDITQWLAGISRADATGKLLNINQDGVNVEAVAVPNPVTLLSRPAQKAAAWASLKLFNQGRDR